MFIIRFSIPSFTNHVIIQQKVNINQIISYANEIVVEFMKNLLLTIWNQIIMRNINNFGYVRRRIFSFTYKNPFCKKVLKCHLDANSSNCCLVFLSQNMCCTFHMLSNSVHHPQKCHCNYKVCISKSFCLSFLHLPQVSKPKYDDMMWDANKKHMKKKILFMENIIYLL